MVDAAEVAFDIGTQGINGLARVLTGEPLQPGLRLGDALMEAAARSTGIAGGDEAGFPQWLKLGNKAVLQHPITKGQGGDQARLGFVNGEGAIDAAAIAAGVELGLQGEQFTLQVALEALDLWLMAFAAAGAAVGGKEGAKVADSREEVGVGFGDDGEPSDVR